MGPKSLLEGDVPPIHSPGLFIGDFSFGGNQTGIKGSRVMLFNEGLFGEVLQGRGFPGTALEPSRRSGTLLDTKTPPPMSEGRFVK